MSRDIKYVDENLKTICISVNVEDGLEISESDINKALMIAMNYLLENMEIDKQKEPE